MTLETIEALLSQATGSEVVADDQPAEPFHPQAFSFYNEVPRRGPELSKKPVFQTLLTLNEAGDSVEHRIERKDDTLFYFEVDNMPNDVNHVSGQGLVCEKGSDAESVFVMNALAAVVEAASEPLRGTMDAIRAAKLSLSNGYADKLRKDIFGA